MDSYSFYFCAGERRRFLTKLHSAGWRSQPSKTGIGCLATRGLKVQINSVADERHSPDWKFEDFTYRSPMSAEEGQVKQAEPKLERVIQKLEDSVLGKGEEEPYTIRRGDSPGSTRVPARIREIITKNLSEEDVSSPDGSEGMQPQVAAVQICDAIADFPEVGNVMTSGVHQKWREDGISHHHGSERVGQNIRGPCPETYIGETERSLKTRFLEHRRPSSNTSEVSQHIHIESPGHTVTLDKVRILDTEQDYFVRGVKEAVYIRAHQPSLNRDGGRYRLPATFDALLTSSRFRLPESQRLHHKSDEG
ncbi:hypothetical protein Bbelb_217360 [Branchiostoma belcheri]|nr:hypothetical protein Bbelb_217360 [Branchiostoma belcheri]